MGCFSCLRSLQLQLLGYLLILPQLSQADYILEVRAYTYQNSRHRDSNNDCCDICLFCCGVCDNQFVFCLRGSSTPNDGNPNNCPLGRYSTGEIGDDSFTFSTPNLASGVPNPMTFPGSVWPGAVKLFIEVEDYDSFNADDHVDDIYISISRTPSSTFSSRAAYTGVHGNSRIELSFRVQCSSNFYGSNCTTYCVARDDSGGHYTCGGNGERVCLSGWSEPSRDCTTPKCSSGCHPVGGYCNQPGQCLCNTGWTGSNCNDCIPSQGCSSTGGYCHEPNECICHSGYSGSNCEVDLLPCERQSPCQNGGRCTNNGHGGYTCSCTAGYYGTNCESEINECSSNPCQNGGTCLDRLGAYDCQCPTGFTGDNCQFNIDDCLLNPCRNGAACSDLVNGYYCNCTSGWTGQRCSVNIDDCASNPCQNGSTCYDLVADYLCACHRGLEGKNCEKDRNDCTSNPCVNGYSCVGRNCEIDLNMCRSDPCLNGGTCKNSPGNFSCTCAAGFTGLICDVKKNSEPEASVAASGGIIGGGVSVTVLVVLLVAAVIIVVAVVCVKKRMKGTLASSVSYDNVSDNPAYGMSVHVHDGNNMLSGVSKLKIEEEPCPLYEDLNKLDDKLYVNMKPVSTNASLSFSYEIKKVDCAQELTHDCKGADGYDLIHTPTENY